MENLIGDYRPPSEAMETESLKLQFSPGSLPIKLRWRNNGLSADFLADYVSTFFPRVESDPESGMRRNAIAGAVKYVANELLENAMKYSAEGTGEPISILLQLDPDRIGFWECNAATQEQIARFREFADRLAAGDPGEFYLEQLERSAAGEGSGLGFLTMINDYGARLGWKFEPAGEGRTVVTTHVSLAI